MTVISVNGKEYKIEFGYNSFCDTDLMDRTQSLITMFSANDAATDDDVKAMGKIKDLFCCVRELIFVGLEKHNPVNDLKACGNLLDDYYAETKTGLFDLFTMLAEELTNQGFLTDLLQKVEETAKTTKKKK